MLLIRSLTSATGKDRSTRASPSTEPWRWKKPTPLEYSTTCPIGRLALLLSFCSVLAAGPAPEAGDQSNAAVRVRPAVVSPAAARNHLRMMTPPSRFVGRFRTVDDKGRAGD